ncbi:MAG: molybdopterin-binding protein [Methanomassiliicoccales archaeon]
MTISDSRTKKCDTSGELMKSLVEKAGHTIVLRKIVRDEIDQIREAVAEAAARGADVVVTTGGTGITGRDVTYEALYDRMSKHIDGFGELFRYLSYEQVGAAAMMSRTFAGVYGGMVIFCLPGSPHAVELALQRLILPELGHLVREALR